MEQRLLSSSLTQLAASACAGKQNLSAATKQASFHTQTRYRIVALVGFLSSGMLGIKGDHNTVYNTRKYHELQNGCLTKIMG